MNDYPDQDEVPGGCCVMAVVFFVIVLMGLRAGRHEIKVEINSRDIAVERS